MTANLDPLRTNQRRVFPDGLAWQFEAVSEIEREKSGKTRFCLSRVDRKNWRQAGSRDQNVASVPGR
jgi:hypothetical protein